MRRLRKEHQYSIEPYLISFEMKLLRLISHSSLRASSTIFPSKFVFKERNRKHLRRLWTVDALCHSKDFLIHLEVHVLMNVESSSPNSVNYALKSSHSRSFLELFTTSVHASFSASRR